MQDKQWLGGICQVGGGKSLCYLHTHARTHRHTRTHTHIMELWGIQTMDRVTALEVSNPDFRTSPQLFDHTNNHIKDFSALWAPSPTGSHVFHCIFKGVLVPLCGVCSSSVPGTFPFAELHNLISLVISLQTRLNVIRSKLQIIVKRKT